MAQTFNQYNKGNATIEDIQNAWENGQLPNDVLEYFGDAIDDVVIRSLEQSGYNLYKESLIVDITIFCCSVSRSSKSNCFSVSSSASSSSIAFITACILPVVSKN